MPENCRCDDIEIWNVCFAENSNDLLHQQGTSSSFSQTEPRYEEPTMSLEKSRESINIKNVLSPMSHLNSDGRPATLCYSDDKDEESDSDNLSIIYQTRQEVELRNASQSRGVNKIPNVILCDESDEEEPSNVEGLLDGHISPDDCKDSNNSFVKDLRKGCSDYDLLPGNFFSLFILFYLVGKIKMGSIYV